MTHSGALKAVACLALVGPCVLLAYAVGQDSKGPEFRKQFIQEFRRSSLNTTIGDAIIMLKYSKNLPRSCLSPRHNRIH